ncbi:MAG: ATP-binding protein [Planctomycetota bacterium]|nr:ATP-binding protein [Planctomycetota bacterium]
MLVRLYGENYGAFRDGFSLSLEATDLHSEGQRGYFEVEVRGEPKPMKLLRLAAIYGPNASGKSTIIQAASALGWLVVDSGPRTQLGQTLSQYVPFKLDPNTVNKPSKLGCEVLVQVNKNKSPVRRYLQYEIVFDRQQIYSEHIKEYDGEREEFWLQREKQEIHVPKSADREMTVDLSSVTRANAAAISVAQQLNQSAFKSVYDELKQSLRTVLPSSSGASTPLTSGLRETKNRMHKDAQFRDWALESLLKPADLGITDVNILKRPAPSDFVQAVMALIPAQSRSDAIFDFDELHPKFDHAGVGGAYQLDYDEESLGTRRIFELAAFWQDIARQSRTAFVDELSSSLHPSIVTALLGAVNSPESEQTSQVVFTTHDTALLESALRRDQVYLTEKNDQGIASLYSLSDFKERKENNLRKRYLEGRYGAVPRNVDFGDVFRKDDLSHGSEE